MLSLAHFHSHAAARGVDAAAEEQLAAGETAPDLPKAAAHRPRLHGARVEVAVPHDPDNRVTALFVYDGRGHANARRRRRHRGAGETRLRLEKIDARPHLRQNL